MIQLLVASGNPHKKQELEQIFQSKEISLVTPSEKISIAEDADTYYENALAKARGYYNKYKSPTLADDSGLNILELPNEMGVHSANFGGPGLSDKERALLLLEKLKGKEKRDAYFSCLLCLCLNENEIFYFEGRLEGTMANEYKGENGFGYDPIFIPKDNNPNQLTVSELDPEWKLVHSHRSHASWHLKKFLEQRK